jgi:hypothetical protein
MNILVAVKLRLYETSLIIKWQWNLVLVNNNLKGIMYLFIKLNKTKVRWDQWPNKRLNYFSSIFIFIVMFFTIKWNYWKMTWNLYKDYLKMGIKLSSETRSGSWFNLYNFFGQFFLSYSYYIFTLFHSISHFIDFCANWRRNKILSNQIVQINCTNNISNYIITIILNSKK